MIFSKDFERNPVTLSFLTSSTSERGLANWRGGVEGMKTRASLCVVGWEIRELILVTGEEEHLSLRATLGTSNSESKTSKVSTWTNKGKVLVIESVSKHLEDIERL